MTRAAASCPSHDLADPFIRAWHFYFVGIQRSYAGSATLALYNCSHCHTTLCLTLVPEQPLEDWADDTGVCDVTTPRLSLAEERAADVRSRAGFVGRAA